jgi:hypothetical protein
MVKLTPALRRQITADWHELFPQLGVYREMWLARRVGPLVHGIVLDTDSTRAFYWPITHVHNLCRPFPVVSLILNQGLLSKATRAKDTIAVQFHQDHYHDAAERLTQASLLPLTGNLATAQVVEAHGIHRLTLSEKYPIRLLEDGILLCAWADQTAKAAALLDEYVREIRKWPPHVMARDGGLEAWEERMRESLRNPSVLRATAEAQARSLKVGDLPFSNLTAS